MDTSYADYIISKFSNFLDPFSVTEISTERLCYPVIYASEEMLKGWQVLNQGKDIEDDLLTQQSLLKDLPDFEKSSMGHSYIADGAAHILRNRVRESFVQLIGMPRIGKSTLLKKIALLAAQDMKQEQGSPAPLLVSLEAVMKKSEITSKMELVEACFAQYEEFEAYLRERFFQGRIIMLFDDVDRADDINYKLVEWVKALKAFVKLPLCVMASRYSGYVETDNIVVMVIDIYPMKLQISLAQSMLSELQFERFVEAITGKCGHFSEFSSTPFLFSLLLEMFRWGAVGTVEPVARGKLYYLAVRHIFGTSDSAQQRQAFEILATDMLLRDAKTFNFFDIKNLGIENIWPEMKTSQIFLVQCESLENKKKSSMSSEEEGFRESMDAESGIGEVKESSMAMMFKNISRRDTTPQWVANSKESYLNYQIARRCIVRGTYTEPSNEVYRFLHLRLLEALAAQNYLNQIEDSLMHNSAGLLMESSAFQKTFNNCFPNNFLFCRRFREVLLMFSSLCSENIFENFIKYLLNKVSIEHCYIVEKLLKERGATPSHRPLINKLKQDKLELARRAFSKSFYHPSHVVQKLCRQDAIDSGISELDMVLIINKNIEYVLKNTHWLYLKQLIYLVRDMDIKMVKALYNKLLEVSLAILHNVTKLSSYKAIVHKVFMSIFLGVFEKGESSTNQGISNFTPPVSSCSTPNKFENEKITDESTIRISFDKIKIPKNEAAVIEKIGSCSKLVSVLIDLLQICPAIDLTLCVKTLFSLGCSISQIHISLAGRFACLEDKLERKEILKVLRMLGFVTQHTVDIPVVCLNLDKDLQVIAKDILKLLNIDKLKKHALGVIVKEESPPVQMLLALRALGYTRREELDPEVVYLLVQFIDHYSLELRIEAIKSLYALIKSGTPIDYPEIRKTLAVVPHVLKDRIRLMRYDTYLRVWSLKCLVALWIALDKGKEDSNATQMFHILVKEQIGSSYIVGNLTSIIHVVKEFTQRSLEEREAAWVCMRKMSPIFEYLDSSSQAFFFTEMKAGLFKENVTETKSILKLLIANPAAEAEKSSFLSIILNSGFESRPQQVRYIAILLANWREISSLKSLIPSSLHLTQDLSRVFNKLRLLIEQLQNIIDNPSSLAFSELKYLSNWYKSLVNQVAENMQWPAKLLPHRNQLLDISADPSFFKDENAPEISHSYTDLDISFPKHSIDSANTDLEEQPPPIEICYQIILAGVRSEGLKHWLLWYLKRSENIQQLCLAAESWNLIAYCKEFYNPHVESLLLRFMVTNPEEVVKIVLDLKLKSDSFCIKIVDYMVKGLLRSENALRAAMMCMELSSPMPLEEIYKMVGICNADPVHMLFLHNCVARVMENIVISSDTQMNSVLKALVSTGCSLLLQHIWNYWIRSLTQKPSFLLSNHTLNILESCNSWDCQFLLSRAKIIGIIPVDLYHKETGSSMSTKKL